jgi:DNA polymerase/3'-5' exonuclease PolX
VSQSPLRLSLDIAADLAARIADGLAPVCDRLEIAGSIRRRCETVGDIELVAIPRFSASLLPDVPGVSLLELELNAWLLQGRLLRANKGETLKQYYIPSLAREGHFFKLEVNVSDAERWPVELAIKTGSANFSHKLVTYRKYGGFLPGHCKITDGWLVYEGDTRLCFADERDFIEWICGGWVPPELRD